MNTPVKLVLAHGDFTIAVSGNEVSTAYTDYKGTSRSSTCTKWEMLVFALNVVRRCAPELNLQALLGG